MEIFQVKHSLNIQSNIKAVTWIMSGCHLEGKCVCDGKEMTVVLKLQLYSMYEYVCSVSSVGVCLLHVCLSTSW